MRATNYLIRARSAPAFAERLHGSGLWDHLCYGALQSTGHLTGPSESDGNSHTGI